MRSFVETADAVGATTKKTIKLQLISDFFKSSKISDAVLAARFLSGHGFASYDEYNSVVDNVSLVLAGFDPTLVAALTNNRKKIEYQLSKMERKIGREAMRRDERASRDAAYLCNLIYPHKHLQERLYSIVPFLAKHGVDLIDRIYENIQLDCPDHRLLTVG